MNMITPHFLLPALVAALALAFLDPFHLLMPTALAQTALGLLVLVTVVYSTLIFKENTEDERERHVRAFTHRMSYLVTVIGLVTIIAYYLLTKGHVYPETVVLLVLVVATKTISHWYADRNC
jgi:hypothetical protein